MHSPDPHPDAELAGHAISPPMHTLVHSRKKRPFSADADHPLISSSPKRSAEASSAPRYPPRLSEVPHNDIHSSLSARTLYFLRNEQPSVRRALPPVGWHRTWEQPAQTTTVWAWEKTVVMVKQPGHLTSMKKERGPGTRVYSYSEQVSRVFLGCGRCIPSACACGPQPAGWG